MVRGILNYLLYLFKKDRKFYRDLLNILGFLPSRVSLYHLAFTHKSLSILMKDGSVVNNERLEFLGDAILGALTAEYIYKEYENADEGFMTKLRSRIVKRKHLNSIAKKMGIPSMVSSHLQSVKSSKHLYGNALEALIGAIYLDRGFKYAVKFFRKRMIMKYIDINSLAHKDSDYKSQLIEWAQKRKKEVVFTCHDAYDSGNTIPLFESEVKIDQQLSGTGKGGSKKEAEQQAAKVALNDLLK